MGAIGIGSLQPDGPRQGLLSPLTSWAWKDPAETEPERVARPVAASGREIPVPVHLLLSTSFSAQPPP